MRVRSEFQEFPGMRLTEAQARRLFGVRDDICTRVLLTLVGDKILVVDGEGRYARRNTML